jgi:hypothetical protein
VAGAVPVAVFFLPKHCTLWEAILGGCEMCVRVRWWAWVKLLWSVTVVGRSCLTSRRRQN